MEIHQAKLGERIHTPTVTTSKNYTNIADWFIEWRAKGVWLLILQS